MTILVIDAGTSGVRSVALRDDGSVAAEHHVPVLPASPSAGLVEIDPVATADAAMSTAEATLAEVGEVEAIGIANQRATTVAWLEPTGEPVANGIGWQDLRTVGRCLELRAEGLLVAPNQTATKAEWLVQRAHDDGADLDALRIGTVDTWLARVLSGGALHATDATNAQVTGLATADVSGWDDSLRDRLGIPDGALAEIRDSTGIVGTASRLPGAPPIASLVGDQQASLVGQGRIEPGAAKVTFGTGAMLDVCLGTDPGAAPAQGTFPIVAWRAPGQQVWAREAVMLAAGSCIEWLRDGLGVIDDAAASDAIAASVGDSDGVVFVPSLSGAGTPVWDHGARGLLIGITRGTTRAHVVRAVLEGVAMGGADLVDAAEADTGHRIETVAVDGGMSANATFVQAIADACQRPVEVSAVREATALGAGFLAGVAVGTWSSLTQATATHVPGTVVEPAGTLDRERFAEAARRSHGWIPELSALDL